MFPDGKDICVIECDFPVNILIVAFHRALWFRVTYFVRSFEFQSFLVEFCSPNVSSFY